MTQKIQYFCDICGKEFPPQEYSFLTGQLLRLDKDLNQQIGIINGHYCGEDTKQIIAFIEELTNKNANNTNTAGVVKQKK